MGKSRKLILFLDLRQNISEPGERELWEYVMEGLRLFNEVGHQISCLKGK